MVAGENFSLARFPPALPISILFLGFSYRKVNASARHSGESPAPEFLSLHLSLHSRCLLLAIQQRELQKRLPQYTQFQSLRSNWALPATQSQEHCSHPESAIFHQREHKLQSAQYHLVRVHQGALPEKPSRFPNPRLGNGRKFGVQSGLPEPLKQYQLRCP